MSDEIFFGEVMTTPAGVPVAGCSACGALVRVSATTKHTNWHLYVQASEAERTLMDTFGLDP
jgi:hypothetical protein